MIEEINFFTMFQGKLRAEKISFFKPIRLSHPCTVTNTFIPTDKHTVRVFFQLGGHNLSSLGLPPLLSWMTLSKLLKFLFLFQFLFLLL